MESPISNVPSICNKQKTFKNMILLLIQYGFTFLVNLTKQIQFFTGYEVIRIPDKLCKIEKNYARTANRPTTDIYVTFEKHVVWFELKMPYNFNLNQWVVRDMQKKGVLCNWEKTSEQKEFMENHFKFGQLISTEMISSHIEALAKYLNGDSFNPKQHFLNLCCSDGVKIFPALDKFQELGLVSDLVKYIGIYYLNVLGWL